MPSLQLLISKEDYYVILQLQPTGHPRIQVVVVLGQRIGAEHDDFVDIVVAMVQGAHCIFFFFFRAAHARKNISITPTKK